MNQIETRLAKIQRHLKSIGHDPGPSDGLLGVRTLTALEKALNIAPPAAVKLTVSRRSLDLILKYEIGSPSYYTSHLARPTWPGGASGVTIGIGYDLGYNSKSQITADWSPHLKPGHMQDLLNAAGRRRDSARAVLPTLRHLRISLDAARAVFFASTLPRFAALTAKTFPGIEDYEPDAQGALLSLVYNRGSSLSGSRRKEMAEIRKLISIGADPEDIADQVREMKRLWLGKGLDGLLKRRHAEACLIALSDNRITPDSDLIRL